MFAKHAQYYLDQGLSVIPAMSNKRPAISTWAPYQTRMPSAKEVEAWSMDLGDMNIAVVCGELSNLLVVDCDTKEAVAKFDAALPDQYEVPSSDTPRGGRHFFFKFTPGLISKAGYRPGIDVRAEGAIALLPPSRTKATPDGKCVDGAYALHNGADIKDRPPLPEESRAFLLDGQPEAGKDGNGGTPPGQVILTQGTRDQDLFHAALQFFKDGLPRDEVERVVVNMAKAESAWKRYAKKNPQAPCLEGRR